MSEIKVSQMPEASNVNDNDLVMIVQGGYNKKVPVELFDIPKKAHQVNVATSVDTDYKVNMIKTKNLFDVNNSKIGVLISDQGVESSNSNWNLVNDYIEVKPNSQITISCQTEQIPQFKVYEYNSSFDWVQRQDYNSGLSNTFTLSATTKYIRIGYRNDRAITNIQVEKGSTATEYTPFINNQINVDNEKYSDTINVGAEEDSRSKVNVLYSKNINTSEIELGAFDSNGLPTTGNTRLRSKDFISVKSNTTYTISWETSKNAKIIVIEYSSNTSTSTQITRNPAQYTSSSYTFTSNVYI